MNILKSRSSQTLVFRSARHEFSSGSVSGYIVVDSQGVS